MNRISFLNRGYAFKGLLAVFAATVKLICSFVLAYAKCWFSQDATHSVYFRDVL